MPMDTSSLYFGLLADKQARAERESRRHAQAGQQSLAYQQQRQQELDRDLEREAKRAEIAAKYSEISGEPIREEFSSKKPVAQGMEAGRLQGAAYDETSKQNRPWDRFALERMRQEGQDRRLAGKLASQEDIAGDRNQRAIDALGAKYAEIKIKMGEAAAREWAKTVELNTGIAVSNILGIASASDAERIQRLIDAGPSGVKAPKEASKKGLSARERYLKGQGR